MPFCRVLLSVIILSLICQSALAESNGVIVGASKMFNALKADDEKNVCVSIYVSANSQDADQQNGWIKDYAHSLIVQRRLATLTNKTFGADSWEKISPAQVTDTQIDDILDRLKKAKVEMTDNTARIEVDDPISKKWNGPSKQIIWMQKDGEDWKIDADKTFHWSTMKERAWQMKKQKTVVMEEVIKKFDKGEVKKLEDVTRLIDEGMLKFIDEHFDQSFEKQNPAATQPSKKAQDVSATQPKL